MRRRWRLSREIEAGKSSPSPRSPRSQTLFGNALLETLFRVLAPTRNRVSQTGVPKQSLGTRIQFSFSSGLFLVLLAAVFVRATNAPIYHLDTWDHWKYGEWIWQ